MSIRNSGKGLEESIGSILKQTFTSFELIIVDCDSNTDRELELLKDERIVYIDNTKPNYIDSLNEAISRAKGKYLTMTDENSIMNNQTLEKQYIYMERNSNIDCCFTWTKVSGYCDFHLNKNFNREELTLALLEKDSIIHSSAMFRKSSLIQWNLFPGLYEAEYLFVENYRLWTVLLTKGCEFGFIPETLLNYKVSGNQYSLRIKKYIQLKEVYIQMQHINYINTQITNVDASKIDKINELISFFEDRQVNFEKLKLEIANLYNSVYPIKTENNGTKKNILFCIPNLDPGGAEKQLITLLERIDLNIYNVDLLVLYRTGVYFDNIPKSINWYTLHYFEKYVNREYDIEVAFLEGPSTKYIGNRKTKAKKIAWVRIDLYNFHWTRKCFKDIDEEIMCYREFDEILFNSNETLERFTQRFGHSAVRKTVIYNLIDRNKIIDLSDEYDVTPPPNVITLCSVGRLSHQKAYERLISILNDLKKEGLSFHFWILGEGPLRERLENMIASFSLGNEVSLIGFNKNPFPYIKQCDVFVQASLAEGFSLVVAEAICLGKPVLATNTAGPAELLDFGEYGCLVENDYHDILMKMRDLIIDESKRNLFSERSRERASMFEINKIFEDIMSILLR